MENRKYTKAAICLVLFVTVLASCNPFNQNSEKAKKQEIRFPATIKEIDFKEGKIKIDKNKLHFMTKWISEDLFVSDKELLENIKTGDTVYLTAKGTRESLIIYRIEKIDPGEKILITNSEILDTDSE